MQTFFQRMIATATRDCSQCDDPIVEGEMFWLSKNEEKWCCACVEYEQQRES